MISVLSFVFGEVLKLLHAFVPFVTEYIYGKMNLVNKGESLIIEQISNKERFNQFEEDAKETEELVNLIVELRRFKLDSGKKSTEKVEFATSQTDFAELHKAIIEKLANITILFDDNKKGNTLVLPVGEFVLVEEEVDVKAQKALLEKDIEKVKFEIERSNKMLSNAGFMAKAPEALVNAEKSKLAKNEELYASLISKLNEIK